MAYTDVELILDQLEDIKDISSAELSLIEQLSVKMLPDKVVNQSSRLKGAMANPVTASNGISKYINLRITAINQAISEIKSKWNEVIPLSTSDITTLKTRLDTLTMGVSEEYNTLLKIENAIKKEVSDREQAITDLINGASSGYDTLKELETAIKKEVSDRSNAITNLINNATTNYNTLGKLETRIKEETANRNSAVSALKGTATSSNDTLGKLETNLNNEISNRENAIEALINNASDGYQTLKELEDKIKAEVAARTQAITKEISDRNSAIQTAISKLVDTAPDLLNTLNELAEALGNDPNFATTVANNIAQSLTTAKAYTDTKISSEASSRDIAISSAISNLKGAATTNYDTLAKLETRIKEEMTNRTNAISDLIGTANTSYDTLGKIQARIEAISGTEEGGLTIEGAITASMDYTDEKVAEETSARNSAINALKNGASSGYDTLKELETAIKNETTTRDSAITQEVSDRNSAITTAINNLKGTAESGYDTLGELQNAITHQKTALENSISQAKTDVKNELLGGAGAAFDTLNELAKALGNDPNFATTVLNNIGAIKGTPTSDYDSLEKIENKLKEEVKAREQAIEEIYDEVAQTIQCNHEYEITGNTGDEHGLAVKDQQMLLKRIEGQTGRYSENELNIEDVTEKTSVGITYSIKKGVIPLNGTPTAQLDINLVSDKIFSKGNYSIQFNVKNITNGITIRIPQINLTGFINNVYNFTLNEDTPLTIICRVLNETNTFSNSEVYPMLVKGTYTEDTIPAFKPYDNTLVNSKCNFISTGRQLWDEEWEQGSIDDNGNNIVNISIIRSKNFIPILKGDYCLTSGYNGIIFLYDINKNFIQKQDVVTKFTITNNSARYIKFRLSSVYGNTYKHDIMLNYGTEALPYEPHIKDSITYNRELTAYGYHDNETNMTYEYGSEVITLDGSSDEDWVLGQTSSEQVRFIYSKTNNSSFITGIRDTIIANNISVITANDSYFTQKYGIANEEAQIVLKIENIDTVANLRTYLQQNPISLIYKQSTPRYTIEEYLPNGYDVYNGGMQIQEIDGKYLPYNLTKVYSVSIADQLTANREIDKGQQEQIDEVKNKASVLEQDKLNAKTNKGYDNTEIINDGESIVIKKFVDDTSTTNRITVDSNKIEIINDAIDEGITKKIVMDDGGITLSIDDNGEASTFNINKNLATITSPSINLNGVDIGSQGYINVLGDATLNNGLNVPNGDVVISNGIDAGTVYVQDFDSEWTNVVSKDTLINFKQKNIQVQKSIPARSFYTVTAEFEKKVLIIGVSIIALVMDRIFCGMPRCNYETPKIFRFDLYNSSENETNVSYLYITYIELE